MNTKIKHEQRRQELFVHINKIIERDGYENLTVRGICHELSISIGTFYHYFPEKSDLAQALFTHIDTYFETEVTALFSDNEYDNLVTYLYHYVDYIMKNGVETCRFVNIAPLKINSKNYLDEQRGIFQVLFQILQRGEDKKQFQLPNGVTETARMLLIIARGYCSEWVKYNGMFDLRQKISFFITTFLPALSC